jgi:hypothetical protein
MTTQLWKVVRFSGIIRFWIPRQKDEAFTLPSALMLLQAQQASKEA